MSISGKRRARQPALRTARDKWETIRYALDETSRTVRLVIIVLAMGLAPGVPLLLMLVFRGR